MDDLCGIMTMGRVLTFPSHTDCSRGPKSCDLVRKLCQLLGGRLRRAAESLADTERSHRAAAFIERAE